MAFRLSRIREIAQHCIFMTPRDIYLFLGSSRTDAKIIEMRSTLHSNAAVFDKLYRENYDPWRSMAPQFYYQKHKYNTLLKLLPKPRFAFALDLGCGLGPMTRLLATRADQVVGLDIAPAAIAEARRLSQGFTNVQLDCGDILNLPLTPEQKFDLVVIADVLYYLSPLSETILSRIAAQVSELLMPEGICLLVNHYFHSAQGESRLTRGIHDIFASSSGLTVTAEHRRPFFLATILKRSDELKKE